jgi:hypothetical protein
MAVVPKGPDNIEKNLLELLKLNDSPIAKTALRRIENLMFHNDFLRGEIAGLRDAQEKYKDLSIMEYVEELKFAEQNIQHLEDLLAERDERIEVLADTVRDREQHVVDLIDRLQLLRQNN